MKSVYEAQRTILANVKPLPIINLPLNRALGHVLREDIKSDRDQPPFNKSLMDGVAINSANKKRNFLIEETITPGAKAYRLKDNNAGVRIMTGSAIPEGCDCIIPIEQLIVENDYAQLNDYVTFKPRQFIRYQASDAKKGQVLLKSGTQLLSVHLGVLASVGKAQVKVTAKPTVAVISTGDELVDVNKPIKPYQTRLSNSYALRGLLEQSAMVERVEVFHLKDNKAQMLKALTKILKDFDIIVLSGGVSMGDFDFVPTVLSQLKVKKLFHKVAQKPGKPFWFGITRDKKPVFALPGNPVSTQICAYRYIVPYLFQLFGRKIKQDHIKLIENVNITSDLTHFLPVKDGKIVAIGGSGDFAALAQADGFIEYDSAKNENLRPYFSWRI